MYTKAYLTCRKFFELIAKLKTKMQIKKTGKHLI